MLKKLGVSPQDKPRNTDLWDYAYLLVLQIEEEKGLTESTEPCKMYT
jgi:hypothetical protein